MTTTELDHVVHVVWVGEVGTGGERAFYGCRAECSCGWVSDDYGEDDAAADAAADDHRAMVDPGAGVDRMLGELLDVQRDLGDICVWLAGCWSEDLPEPYVTVGSPYRRGTLAEVHVQPRNREELDRVAALMSAPVDVDLNDEYVAARRRFGRCELVAWLRVSEPRVYPCEECGTPVDGDACPNCGQRMDADGVVVVPGDGGGL